MVSCPLVLCPRTAVLGQAFGCTRDPEEGTPSSPSASPRAWLTMPSSVTLPSALGREPPLCFCPRRDWARREDSQVKLPSKKRGHSTGQGQLWGSRLPSWDIQGVGGKRADVSKSGRAGFVVFFPFFFFLT